MASPFTAGLPSIAKRLLTGKSRMMVLGDSVWANYEPYVHKIWKKTKLAGVGIHGSTMNGFFGTDARMTVGQGGLDLGSPVIGASAQYAACYTREMKFTGTAYGVISGPLDNRIESGWDGRWDTTRGAVTFDGSDWLSTAPDMQLEVLMYRDASSVNALAQLHLSDNTTFTTNANVGFPNLTNAGGPTYTLYTAAGVPGAGVAGHRVSFDVRMASSAAPPANSNCVPMYAVVSSPSKTGLTLLQNAIGGWTVAKWLPGALGWGHNYVSQAAINGVWGNLGVTDFLISLTTNGSNNGVGGTATQAQLETQLGQLVSCIRTACPDASILFASGFDENNAGSAAHVASYVDAHYNAQQATANSAFINLYAACPPYSQISGDALLTDGVHPTTQGRWVFLSKYEGLLEELAAKSKLYGIGSAVA